MAYTFASELADAKLAEYEAFRRTYEAPDHAAWVEALDDWLMALQRLQETRRRASQVKSAGLVGGKPVDRLSDARQDHVGTALDRQQRCRVI